MQPGTNIISAQAGLKRYVHTHCYNPTMHICISEKPIVAPPLDAVEYGDIQGIEEVFN